MKFHLFQPTFTGHWNRSNNSKQWRKQGVFQVTMPHDFVTRISKSKYPAAFCDSFQISTLGGQTTRCVVKTFLRRANRKEAYRERISEEERSEDTEAFLLDFQQRGEEDAIQRASRNPRPLFRRFRRQARLNVLIVDGIFPARRIRCPYRLSSARAEPTPPSSAPILSYALLCFRLPPSRTPDFIFLLSLWFLFVLQVRGRFPRETFQIPRDDNATKFLPSRNQDFGFFREFRAFEQAKGENIPKSIGNNYRKTFQRFASLSARMRIKFGDERFHKIAISIIVFTNSCIISNGNGF